MLLFNKQLNADAREPVAGATEDVATAATATPKEPEAAVTEMVAIEELEAAPEVAEPAVETVASLEPEAVAIVAEVPETVATIEPEAAPVVTAQPVEETVATAHDDFDWTIDKRNVSVYNKTDREKYDKVYEETFRSISDNEMIVGTVVGLTKTDAVINIGFKSDGLISLNEFRDAPIKVGDEVEIMVVEKEDRDGNLHLSRRQARISRAWERIVEAHKSGEVVTGTVTSKTKGGLIVDVFGMETFLPGSQIDVKPVTDYDQFVNKMMELF
jgi:small subunit ribosomal protein S1